jgi:hypothetical protein
MDAFERYNMKEYLRLKHQKELDQSLIESYLSHAHVTVCNPGAYHKTSKKGKAMLGLATAGRAYFQTGKRHVYSK